MNRDLHSPLRNGANLIARKSTHRDQYVVLAEVPATVQPFVTWVEDADGNLFWGHYFETLAEARTDYDRRGAVLILGRSEPDES